MGKNYLESKVNHPRFRQFFAVHETEAWLLSETCIFPAQIRSGLTAKSRQPETVNFHEPPAKLLGNLYNAHTKQGYRKTMDGPKLFRGLNPDVAYQKCPSLKLLLDEMLALAKAAGL